MISLSAAAACSIASVSVEVIRHSSLGEYFFMRSRYIAVRSVDETARARSSGASSVTRQNATSSRRAGARGPPFFGIVVSKRGGPLTGCRSGNPGRNENAGSVSSGISILRRFS